MILSLEKRKMYMYLRQTFDNSCCPCCKKLLLYLRLLLNSPMVMRKTN